MIRYSKYSNCLRANYIGQILKLQTRKIVATHEIVSGCLKFGYTSCRYCFKGLIL
jgi:hypothetical protein